MTQMLRAIFMMILWGFLAGCVTTVVNPQQKPGSMEDRVNAQLALGRGYLAQGNYGNARKPLESALTINPRSAEAHVLMAILSAGELEFEEAEKEYRLALRYDRNGPFVLNNFGSFLYARNRYDEALKYLERAVVDTSYPGRSQAFETLGLTQLKLGDEVSGEQSLQRAVRLNSARYRAMLELSDLYFSQGKTDLALNHYDSYLQIARQTPRSLWLGIRISRKIEDRNRLASYALALRNLFPNSSENRLYQDSLK